jgi:hypothetical protein
MQPIFFLPLWTAFPYFLSNKCIIYQYHLPAKHCTRNKFQKILVSYLEKIVGLHTIVPRKVHLFPSKIQS